jgi:omega-6 fatty acid desaturase (delta-12 desaturase)
MNAEPDKLTPDLQKTEQPKTPVSDWRKVVARYQGSHVGRSLFQLVTTLGLLVVTLVAMHRMLHVETWVTIVLIIPAAGFIIRTFIIMHDCSHGSFLPWPKVNDAVGFVTGVLTLTPYSQWRREHALHHASSGDLDRRGNGDVTTITVREYLALGKWDRFKYRLFRNPAVLIGLGPLHMMILQRFRSRGLATGSVQLWNVWMTNIAIAGLVATLAIATSAQSLLIIYLPAYYLATMAGVWLFYVQHQFEDAYWESHENWDYATAAVQGSSHLRLPRVLQWFTGSIGLHHVHHLGPRIPNYKLQRAHDENAIFHAAPVMTIRSGVRALMLTLYDEQERQMIRFKDLRRKKAS